MPHRNMQTAIPYGTPPKRWSNNGTPSLQGGGCFPSPERYRLTSTLSLYCLLYTSGRDASINDDGMFTEKGYIYNNRNTFTEWYDGRDVPQEYRVTPQPPQPERPEDVYKRQVSGITPMN